MLKIALCDDEAAAVTAAEHLVQHTFDEKGMHYEITGYTSADVLFNIIKAGSHYDLLLLDIDMPQMDGIDIGVTLSDLLQETLLVYISSREDRVFEAFRAKPFRFVRKYRLMEEWPDVADAILQELNRRKQSRLTFNIGNQVVAIKPEDIIYIEAQRKNQVLYTTKGQIELTDHFDHIAGQLQGFGFIRIHRSYIVNFRWIHAIDRNEVALDHGEHLPIGRTKYAVVQQEYHRLLMLHRH